LDSSCPLPPDVVRLEAAVRLLVLQQRALAGLAERAEVEALAALLGSPCGGATT
jgi:hypothetical protein